MITATTVFNVKINISISYGKMYYSSLFSPGTCLPCVVSNEAWVAGVINSRDGKRGTSDVLNYAKQSQFSAVFAPKTAITKKTKPIQSHFWLKNAGANSKQTQIYHGES